MKKDRIAVFGSGAQAKYVLEAFSLSKSFAVDSIIDLGGNEDRIGTRMYDVPIMAWNDDYLCDLAKRDVRMAIVTHSNSAEKEKTMIDLMKRGFEFINAIHPHSIIAGSAILGKNVIVNAGAIIQPFATIGTGVMIHAGVIIEHDNCIGDFVNLAPGVKLAGWVTVKKGAYIYTNASVIPRITVGENAVVGAGAVVVNNVPDRVKVVGTPARIIGDI